MCGRDGDEKGQGLSMSGEERLYIAFDGRAGLHCLVRLVPDREEGEPVSRPSVECLNSLLMAKDVEGLFDAAASLGRLRGGYRALPDLCFGSVDPLRERLLPSRQDLLLSECFFDPYSTPVGDEGIGFKVSVRRERARARSAVERHDWCSAVSKMGEGHLSGYLFVLEPIQDWVLLRNLLSVSMRVAGALRTLPEEAPVLEMAGFRRAARASLHARIALDAPAYVIPIAFNSFFRDGSVLKHLGDAVSPLLFELAEAGERHCLTNIFEFRGGSEIKLLSAVQAEPGGTAGTDEEKWLYLAVEEGRGDKSQAELAVGLLRAVDRSIGATDVAISRSETDEVAGVPFALAQGLWDLFRHHPGHYILTCDQCRRSILVTHRGGRKRFCGGTCRSVWSREHNG